MRRIREVVVVEGRYDKNALRQVVDATVVETRGFGVFNDKERLALLPADACVINVGRGNLIDTEALVKVLKEGHLGGVALDVTDPEPLPAGHPLWDAPGVLITPHTSGGYALPETLAQIAEIFAENLERFLKGGELKNIVDPETGYCR